MKKSIEAKKGKRVPPKRYIDGWFNGCRWATIFHRFGENFVTGNSSWFLFFQRESETQGFVEKHEARPLNKFPESLRTIRAIRLKD